MTEKELSGLFKHSAHLQERLDFIKYAVVVSKTRLNQGQLVKLWKIVITDNSYLEKDHKIFYTWLSQLSKQITDKESELMDSDELRMFFREVCSDDKSYMNYEKLSREGYECVLGFFLRSNKESRRLI